MSRFQFLSTGTRAIFASFVLTLVFTTGVAAGMYFYPQVFAIADEHDEHDPHSIAQYPEAHTDEPDEEDHVALTKQAFANLDLKLGTVSPGDYWKTILVPGKVVEIPGRSDLSVSAPVAGVIESVNIVPGQTLVSDAPLVVIRLTDEALLAAQAKYLESAARQEVAELEISRLSPLVASGAVSGAKKRELEYEVKQLQAQQTTLLQELRGRGLPERQIKEFRRSRSLASTLAVYAPSFVISDTTEPTQTITGFSIEHLLVHPGKSVARGESLCTVAFHRKLYIEGIAFEADLPAVERIASNGWKLTAESMSESGHERGVDELPLKLLRVDNHVQEIMQTVRFYVELPNEVTQRLEEDGRYFEQWRFRPGQRLHLRLPVERWQNQLTLPLDAVVVDGPNVFVFAEHHHHDPELHESMPSGAEATLASVMPAASRAADVHDHDHDHDHEHDVFIEFEPVPVRLLHRDDKTVVIANDGQIHEDDRIALNHAYKLYLAMKMNAGGGGGHHHHH